MPVARLSSRAADDLATPLRLAFVGQATYFDYCALQEPAGGVVPTFVDYRYGLDPEPMLDAVQAFRPHVVFVFRPELIPEGALAGLEALTVGFLTEPITRPEGAGHPDLEERRRQLHLMDPGNFDRIISFDPLVAPTADEVAPVWRSFPLPVADRYFAPVTPPRAPARALFTGRHTDWRESFLAPVKHRYDVIHLAFGVHDEKLIEFLADTEIGINLHNHPYPTFENRVCVYLAAGNLLISEPLSPTHGLEPGIDFLEVTTPDALVEVMAQAVRLPEAFQRVRVHGRRKAERFRASRVYPALVRDVIHDVAVFGTPAPLRRR